MNQDFLQDPEFQELIRQYLDYLSEELPKIREHLKSNNLLEVQKFGHNLKGNGGSYGLSEFSEIGQKIENAGKEQNTEELNTFLDAFEKSLHSAKERFQEMT